ncbi:MAG: ATP-grasp domain-containing protein, partial [Chloroflexota bacterium]
DRQVDAIHPGYGFLAERPDFARLCQDAGIVFVGPPGEVLEAVTNRTEALSRVKAAGLPVVEHSPLLLEHYQHGETIPPQEIARHADRVGYPLVVKPERGGRGRGMCMVASPDGLEQAVRRVLAYGEIVHAGGGLYLEKAILPMRLLSVQVIAARPGEAICLGEVESIVQRGSRRMIEEAPSPGVFSNQREGLYQAARTIAGLFGYANIGAIEFLVNRSGQPYFTEIKPRLQPEHPLTEMRTQVDLVAAQIRIAAGETVNLHPEISRQTGCALMARIFIEGHKRNCQPASAFIRQFIPPSGPHVRVDTHLYTGCFAALDYDPLIAKLTVWGEDREACLLRLRCALGEWTLAWINTNLPYLQSLLKTSDLSEGVTPEMVDQIGRSEASDADQHSRELAAALAVAYTMRSRCFTPSLPARLISGWHRNNRVPPKWAIGEVLYGQSGGRT